MTIEYRMYLKFLQNLAASVASKQAKRSTVKKTRLNSSKNNFITKSFRLSTKRKLSILLNFLFPFVFYRRVFNLEIQNFGLKNHHMMNARQPFCWWMLFTLRVDHLTFVAGYVWFSLSKNFFPKPLELDIFSSTYNGVRFFVSAWYVMSDIFFSAGYCFSEVFPCKLFSLEISRQDIFLWSQP